MREVRGLVHVLEHAYRDGSRAPLADNYSSRRRRNIGRVRFGLQPQRQVRRQSNTRAVVVCLALMVSTACTQNQVGSSSSLPPEEILSSPTETVASSPTQAVVSSPTETVPSLPTQAVVSSPSRVVVPSPTQVLVPSPTQAAGLNVSSTSPCGSGARAPATYKHIIVFFMQDKIASEVYGSPKAPYLNTLGAACGIATNYHWVWHPSFLPIISGAYNDPLPRGCTLAECLYPGQSIFSQLKDAGKTWRNYAEEMPSNCARSSKGGYTPTHNPPVYYRNLMADCAAWDVPMGTVSAGAFVDDLNNDRLPSYSFMSPTLCHDTHDCELAEGDKWLQTWMTKILNSAVYRAGGAAVFIVWDDGTTDAPGVTDCTTSSHPYCLVSLFVISPYTPGGTRSGVPFSHYSLLRTTEEMLGITSFLGGAARATSLRAAFGL